MKNNAKRGKGRLKTVVGRKRGRKRKPPCTIERYQTCDRFKSLAENRTKNIRSAWARWGDDSLAMLCQSCYLQGVEDGFTAVEHKKANDQADTQTRSEE